MAEKIAATQRQRQRLVELNNDFSTWADHYKDISEYMMPRKGRYLFGTMKGQDNDGSKKHSKIINGSAADALRIIAAGMQGGLTSPSRPWMKLGIPDKDKMEFQPVREYLDLVRDRMLLIFARSNFYGATHGNYKELAGFGTAGSFLEEDLERGLRVRPFTIGEYRLALDAQYRPAVLYRQFTMTAAQMLEKFGEKAVTEPVLSAYKSGAKGSRFEVVHCVEPNLNLSFEKKDHRGMKYSSMYFELNADPDKVLRRRGYRTIPFIAPRWDVAGCDSYGESPGMDALGDVKQLQKVEAEKLENLAKANRPPMNAHISMKGKGGTVVPGGVNYIDPAGGAVGFMPAYQVQFATERLQMEIRELEQRIRRYFFNDMFLAIIQNERTMTATEVAKRYEEKMIVLGPVIERLQHEMLDPIVERTFSIMQELDLLPPPPKEIQGMDVSVQYISVLAQAQKMIGITALEQTATFIGNLSQIFPEAKDKLNVDQLIDEYGEAVGVGAKIIRSDDEVAQMRAVMAQKQRMAEASAMAGQAAQTAKTASEINTDNPAMGALLNGVSSILPART